MNHAAETNPPAGAAPVRRRGVTPWHLYAACPTCEAAEKTPCRSPDRGMPLKRPHLARPRLVPFSRFTRLVRQVMAAHGVTLVHLARLSNRSIPTIYNHLHDDTRPMSFATAEALLGAMGYELRVRAVPRRTPPR